MVMDPFADISFTGRQVVSPSEQRVGDSVAGMEDPQVEPVQDDPFAGILMNDNPIQTEAPPEPASELNPLAQGTPEKGTGLYDYLYGSMVELPTDLVWGAVSWPVSQIVRHGAVAGQKIQQAMGLVPQMTPEQQAAMGENVANWIQTLGGLAEPQTETGRAGLELAGKVIEPINKIAHWTAQGINPEKHPNLHNLVATGVEFGLFATIPKVGKGLKSLRAKRVEAMKLKGEAKAKAELDIIQQQETLLKEMEDGVAAGKWKEVHEAVAERKRKNQQLMAGAEGFSAITPTPEMKARAGTTMGEQTREPFIPEQREAPARGFEEGEVRSPAREPAIEPVVPQADPFVDVTLPVTERGVPRREFQIDPETGLEQTVDQTGRSVYKIEDGKMRQVERVPGQRSVWKVMLDPLKNETGAVDLTPLKEAFGKAPKGASLLSQLVKKGLSREDLMLSGLGSYLTDRGQQRINWKKVKEIADEGGFDVRKEKVPDPRYTGESYNLQRGKQETYKETLYKYDPNKAIENQKQQVEMNLYKDLISIDEMNKQLDSLDSQILKPYQESHWGEKGENVMAHDRRHERMVSRKDTIYLEELQSNWHRDGGREGYGAPIKLQDKAKTFAKELGVTLELTDKGRISNKTDSLVRRELRKADRPEDLPEWNKLIDDIEFGGVPNAPFKKTWPHMIARDVIANAVAKGKDGIAWSTGKIQAERWGNKAQTKRDAVYDKTLPKFFKKEFDVKAEKKGSYTSPGITEEVWYVPLTAKMKKLYRDRSFETIFDQLVDPLRNERGQLNINFGRKKLKEKLTESQRERIRKIGRSIEASGMSLDDFLRKQGMSVKKQRDFKKLHDLIKQEKPFESALTKDKTPFNNDPLELQKGDVNVNVIQSKRLNPAIQVGRKVINQLESAKRTITPSFVKTFQPTWAGMKKFKIPLTKELWHKVNNIEKARLEDLTVVKEKIAELQETYPKKKLREEAFVKMMSKDKLGRDAMEKLGIRPIDGAIKYEGLALELEPLFKEMLDRINDTRVSIGKKKITRRDNYLPMIAQESFYDKIRTLYKGDDATIGRPNMVLDSLKDINYRHDFSTAEATNFRHIKRGKLRRGTKLDKDPLALYGKYGNTALRHIHYSPLNAFVEQLVRGKFTDSKGKNFELSKRNPELATFLSRWSNKLAGRPNVILPEGLRFLENGAQKISNNLTAATLGWSIRTVMVQPTAMLPVMSEFGVAPTMKGLLDTVSKSKSAPIEKSSVLAIRTADVFINDMVNFQLKGKLARKLLTPQNKALSAMKFVDSVIAEAAWRTAYKDASKSLGEQAAIRHADEVVVRTQGSGFAGDLSPIQMNAMGKAVTLWQTFTINHINWIGKEILDIKHPERNPVETSRRVMTYLVGSALISTMFEDVMGIQSPQPAPIKAIQKGLEEGDTGAAAALKGLLELTEILPIGSSVKFRSDPAGAVFQFLGDVSEGIGKDLPEALNGDKKAMQRLAFLLAKGVGVAGSGQVSRYVKGKQRGESTIGALLGTYTPERKSSGRGRTKRSKRSKRTTRPTR